ncbi:MAG: chondroitin lyase [Adhaeribacter sp.]|nr:chondroitin lyase [Adhaeribacter sp.]
MRHPKFIFLLAVAGLGWSQSVYSHSPAGLTNNMGVPARGKTSTGFVSQTVSQPEAKVKASADLETIRQRIISDLVAPAIDEAAIIGLIRSIKPDGSWPDINYQDVSRTGFQHSRHLENMLALSRALKKSGSKFYGNPEVKKTVSTALDFWLKHDFICDNWWWNEMGTPNLMINTLLVLDTDLTEKQRLEGVKIANRANLSASGARPGGDLIQIAGMLGKQGLFSRDEAILAKVVQVMAEEIKVTTGRGLKPDLSFHHRTDNVISTLAYGTGYANSFAYWAVKIAGTKFSLPESATKLLIDYFLDGICQSMVYGRYPDPGAENRGITRQNALNAASPELAQNLLLASNYRREELAGIVKIRRGEQTPALSGTRYFWHSEYFTHQRPAYFASVRMHSSRGNNMEEPHNEEGLKNHHYADGSNFISLTGKEYFNIFPVWDWQKIPGTTVVQKPELPHWKQIARKGRSSFVGGVTDGEFGAAAFDFISVHDPLKARKAWFFFAREYVCLGAGISAEADYPVATTLNQCLLNEQVVVKRNNQQESLSPGTRSLAGVSWITHDNIAYIFPAPTVLHVQNAAATGNWQSINHQAWATKEEVKKDVFKIWLDHGTKPNNAGYAYTVVPNIQPAAVEDYRKNSGISILANTPDLQAVKHTGLNQTQVVFYKAGKIKISKDLTLIAESPGMVMLTTGKKGLEKIVVSDPSRQLKSLQLAVTSRFEGAGENWQATWNKKNKVSNVLIHLPAAGLAGQSVVLEIKEKKPE